MATMLRVGELNGGFESSSVIPTFLDGQRIANGKKLVVSDAYCCSPDASVEDACKSEGASESQGAQCCAPELADSDGSDDKGYCSSPVLDPISFDHCYVSCQRLSWSSDKGKGHVAPRIKTLGSFEQAAEVATKLKQKNGDDRLALGGENLSPSGDNEDEVSEGVQADGSKNINITTGAESACELSLKEGDGHDYFTSSMYSQGSSPDKGVMPATFDYVKPAGSGSTINLSGGFQQLREAQANNPLTSGSGPYGRKGSFICPSSAAAYGCPKLQGAVSPIKESEKTSFNDFTNCTPYAKTNNALNRRPPMISSPSSTAPVLEQVRVVPRSTRSNFDVEDSNQSVYERIRIALEKAEAQKQLLSAKADLSSSSVDKSIEEGNSGPTNPVSADKKQKKKDKEPTKEKIPRKYKKKEALRSAEEDYVTRCLCGFCHNDEFMIQCDRCEVWQHCECLGIKPANVPEKYLCEVCEPRLLPFTSEEANHLQFVKLNASKHGSKKVAEKRKRSQLNGDALVAKEGHKKRARLEDCEPLQQCSAELGKLVKAWQHSPQLDKLAHKLRPSPPCKVLYVAPNVTGLVLVYTLAPDVPILECFGRAALLKECRGQVKAGIPQPNVFLVHDFAVGDSPSVDLCLRFASEEDQWMQHVRRSCHPNSKISVVVDEKGLRFFLVSTTKIEKGEEVCVPFDYDFRKSTGPITCACTSIHETARDHECPVESFNNELEVRKARKKSSSKLSDKETTDKGRKNRVTSTAGWNARRSASAKADSAASGRAVDHDRKPRSRKTHRELISLQQNNNVDRSGETSEGSGSLPSSADYSKGSRREARKMQFILERIERMEHTEQKPKRRRSNKGSSNQNLTPTDGSDKEGSKSSAPTDVEPSMKLKDPFERELFLDVRNEEDANIRRKSQPSESAEDDSKEMSSERSVAMSNEKDEGIGETKRTSASPLHLLTDEDALNIEVSPNMAGNSRNAIGVISLLASAVYLSKCEKEAAAQNASDDVVATETSRKVRKMSIDEYKLLKRDSSESAKNKQRDSIGSDGGRSDLSASTLPSVVEKPSSLSPLCADELLRSVGSNTPSLIPFPMEENVKPQDGSILVDKEGKSTAEPEPESGEELDMDVKRGALADRLDVLRPLFDLQCDEKVTAKDQEVPLVSQQNNLTPYGHPSYYPAQFSNGVCHRFDNYAAYGSSYSTAPCMLPFGFYSRVPPPPSPAMLPQPTIACTAVPSVQCMQPPIAPGAVPAIVPPGYMGNLDYLVMLSGTAAVATTAVALAATDQAVIQKQTPTTGSMHRLSRCFGSESDDGTSSTS